MVWFHLSFAYLIATLHGLICRTERLFHISPTGWDIRTSVYPMGASALLPHPRLGAGFCWDKKPYPLYTQPVWSPGNPISNRLKHSCKANFMQSQIPIPIPIPI